MKIIPWMIILSCSISFAQTKVIRVNKTSSEETNLAFQNHDINKLNLESKIIGKTALPALYRFKKRQLILNGAGLRELLWVDIYACGLYLHRPNTDPVDIVDRNETMIMRMDILSKAVSHDKMVKAFYKGFIDGNSKDTIEKYGREIDVFLKHIEGLKLKVGDKVDVVYEPSIGVSLYLNYNKVGTVGNLGFKKAIFNIWLSDNPVDKSLHKELLEGAKSFLDTK